MTEGAFYVYGLYDPTDGSLHYIGKSNNPQRRYYEHVGGVTEGRVAVNRGTASDWIRVLYKKRGVVPEMRILEVCNTEREAFNAETRRVHDAIRAGIPVTNRSNSFKWKHGITFTDELWYNLERYR